MHTLFKLPEHAYKCEGQEVVGGKVFTDGELVVGNDDAIKMAPVLCGFYGVTMEAVVEVDPNAKDSNVKDPSLGKDQTKGSAPVIPPKA